MAQPHGAHLQAILDRQDDLRRRYIEEPAARTPTTARGIHHTAFICRDVEETIRFYRDVMGFPLVELMENRDYPGSAHFFFDLGAGNLLGFFDFPGHPHPEYAEAIGGIHHLALSVTEDVFEAVRARLDARAVPYMAMPGAPSLGLYVTDPNGLRLELDVEPLGQVAGVSIL